MLELKWLFLIASRRPFQSNTQAASSGTTKSYRAPPHKQLRPSWDEVGLYSVVSGMHLLTACAVSGGHLVCVAVGVKARLGRGGSDVLVAILGWIRCGVPLTGRSGAQHSFNRITGIDSHVVLWVL